jgi:hypothetical protein
MKLLKGLALASGLLATTAAHANTCELKFGYFISCSGGAAITLINGVQVGGCEWIKASVEHVRALKEAGACNFIQVTDTDCDVPALFHNAAQLAQDKIKCNARALQFINKY